MLECFIIGDSIAVGVAQHRPECASDTRIGRASMAQRTPANAARVVVISLGSNDAPTAPTADHLRRIRGGVQASIVFWIVPAAPRVAAAVREVSEQFHDNLIETRPVLSADGVHPTSAGYRMLARATRIP